MVSLIQLDNQVFELERIIVFDTGSISYYDNQSNIRIPVSIEIPVYYQNNNDFLVRCRNVIFLENGNIYGSLIIKHKDWIKEYHECRFIHIESGLNTSNFNHNSNYTLKFECNGVSDITKQVERLQKIKRIRRNIKSRIIYDKE